MRTIRIAGLIPGLVTLQRNSVHMNPVDSIKLLGVISNREKKMTSLK